MKATRGKTRVISDYRGLIGSLCILSGVLAAGMGIFHFLLGQEGRLLQGIRFYWDWMGVLAFILLCGGCMWWRMTRLTGKAFWPKGSGRFICAFLAPLVAGGIVSYELVSGYDEFELCALCWVMCYGAALVSVRQIAPVSLPVPGGWKFLFVGALVTFFWRSYGAAFAPQLGVGELEAGAAIMILCFGILHLVQGAVLLLTKGK